MSADELLAEVLRLPRTERARVAEEVLTSLDESEDRVAASWAEELGRRSREVADGTVETLDWETAQRGILSELAERRARRAAS